MPHQVVLNHLCSLFSLSLVGNLTGNENWPDPQFICVCLLVCGVGEGGPLLACLLAEFVCQVCWRVAGCLIRVQESLIG